MYIYIYIYVYIYAHTHIYIYISTYIYTVFAPWRQSGLFSSDVTHMNESCHSDEFVCVIYNAPWRSGTLSHVTHRNLSCNTYRLGRVTYVAFWRHSDRSLEWCTRMNVSCHTYEWNMSCMSMVNVTHMNRVLSHTFNFWRESGFSHQGMSHIGICHVARVNWTYHAWIGRVIYDCSLIGKCLSTPNHHCNVMSRCVLPPVFNHTSVHIHAQTHKPFHYMHCLIWGGYGPQDR